MLKNWGKLVYPKFLENWDGEIRLGNATIWAGKCYFAWRSRGRHPKDGRHDDVVARATTDTDFVADLQGEGELIFKVNNRDFLVNDWRPNYNPDGTFHHLSFELLEI